MLFSYSLIGVDANEDLALEYIFAPRRRLLSVYLFLCYSEGMLVRIESVVGFVPSLLVERVLAL